MFDYKLSLYEKIKEKKYFQNFFLNQIERVYRLRKFDRTISSDHVDWWDYQWDFARFINSGLAIVPEYNLVRNIGFGEEATHTQNGKSKSAKMKTIDIEFPLHHPPFMIRDHDSDKRYFRNFIKDAALSKVLL
jgi:hypothetical protein